MLTFVLVIFHRCLKPCVLFYKFITLKLFNFSLIKLLDFVIPYELQHYIKTCFLSFVLIF